MTQSDIPAVARVHVQSWTETYTGLIDQRIHDEMNYEFRLQLWTKIYAKGEAMNRVFYVFECPIGATGRSPVQDQIVGFSSAGLARHDDLDCKGELFMLYLLQSHQGKGVGQKLFNAATTHLKDNHLTPYYCTTLDGGPAMMFYEKMGGKIVKRESEMRHGCEVKHVYYRWG